MVPPYEPRLMPLSEADKYRSTESLVEEYGLLTESIVEHAEKENKWRAARLADERRRQAVSDVLDSRGA